MTTFPTPEAHEARLVMAQRCRFPYVDNHGEAHNVSPVLTEVRPLTDRQIEQLKMYRERRHLWIAERDRV